MSRSTATKHADLTISTFSVVLAPNSGSSALADDALIRRRDSLTLFMGFLCYIKGDSLDECQHDRSVMNIIRHLDDKQSSAPVAERLSSEPGVVPKSGFPLPPQDGRKRDAFYSDWKRK
ncbi:hypothetical protein LSH36_796g00024 [Paralvinella palmiformis]|uniref:Uncharacterized protein n=1 Tax=Paralvinella palmiformis TaxID=53620 RepID=A0AAD9MU64_9ANNE|nr:hypothetical protein LSH36_796g00024 [Paralvinella palmiformis]